MKGIKNVKKNPLFVMLWEDQKKSKFHLPNKHPVWVFLSGEVIFFKVDEENDITKESSFEKKLNKRKFKIQWKKESNTKFILLDKKKNKERFTVDTTVY